MDSQGMNSNQVLGLVINLLITLVLGLFVNLLTPTIKIWITRVKESNKNKSLKRVKDNLTIVESLHREPSKLFAESALIVLSTLPSACFFLIALLVSSQFPTLLPGHLKAIPILIASISFGFIVVRLWKLKTLLDSVRHFERYSTKLRERISVLENKAA